METNKSRIERSRREQEERGKAIKRDSVAYKPSTMKSRMPVGCSFVLMVLLAVAIVGGTWLLVKLARG